MKAIGRQGDFLTGDAGDGYERDGYEPDGLRAGRASAIPAAYATYHPCLTRLPLRPRQALSLR